MPFSDEQLQKLRDDLPRGAAKKLAERFNFKSVGSVRHILNGVRNNDEVIIAATEMAKAHQESLKNTQAFLAAS